MPCGHQKVNRQTWQVNTPNYYNYDGLKIQYHYCENEIFRQISLNFIAKYDHLSTKAFSYQSKHAAPFPVGSGFFQFSMNEYIVQVDCLLFFIIDLQWTFISVSKLKEQNAHSPPPTLLLPQKLNICNLRHTQKVR